jgi:hypothetical protein
MKYSSFLVHFITLITLSSSASLYANTVNVLDYNPGAADATDAIQSAIDSGASRVLIPYRGSAYSVRPLFARSSNQEILAEPGVVIEAKADAFHGANDSLFTIRGVHDVTLTGYGATLRMRKADYQDSSKYSASEFRHGIHITCETSGGAGLATERITVRGFHILSSGGDGIAINGHIGYPDYQPLAPTGIELRDLVLTCVN